MPTNVNPVAVIEEAFQALDALDKACDAIVEKPLDPKLPGQIADIRKTLTGLMKAAQQHHIDQYLPKG